LTVVIPITIQLLRSFFRAGWILSPASEPVKAYLETKNPMFFQHRLVRLSGACTGVSDAERLYSAVTVLP
jgi:hypothetical protein